MIAEGGYGCVFRPSIPCPEKNDLIDSKDYVSKIVIKLQFAF